METLEELQAILDGAPEGSTHISDGDYFKLYDFEWNRWAFVFDIQDWYIDLDPSDDIRSLSDIQRIVDLKKQVKSGYEAYARIETVKQEYNYKNKSFQSALGKIATHIQKSQPSFCMGGVDSDDEFNSASKIIGYIESLEGLNREMHQQVNGYLHGEDWEHWQAFNQKRFLL